MLKRYIIKETTTGIERVQLVPENANPNDYLDDNEVVLKLAGVVKNEEA